MEDKKGNGMRYAGLATQWMVMLLGGVWLGYKLDKYWHTTPIFVILFPLISLVISLIGIVKEFNRKK